MAEAKTKKAPTGAAKVSAEKAAEKRKEEELKATEVVVEEKNDRWEVKDRTYILKQGSPITATIKSRGIYYFDEEKGYERELKYTTNQTSVFVDEFNGDARLAHITFKNGILVVPKNQRTLQELLSLYHPHKDKIYFERDPELEAENDMEQLDLEFEAGTLAREMDIDLAEAILRVEKGSEVSTMTSKEINRDIRVMARKNPKLLIELANDPNVELRNNGIKAVEQGIISLSQDQRSFSWGNTGRKLFNIPFEENPYSALAAWFKTDEGVDVYKSVEKRLK